MLTASLIREQVENNRIKIHPYNPEFVQPNSYDVHLAPSYYKLVGPLDVRKEYSTIAGRFSERGTELQPGEVYLGVTDEWTETHHHIPKFEGVSTLARYGVFVHITAGVGDIGFTGHWTLEIVTVKPVVVYPHMRIGQLLFSEPSGAVIDNYSDKGHYYGEFQEDPQPQKARANNL